MTMVAPSPLPDPPTAAYAAEATALLTVRDLSLDYGHVRALDGVSLLVRPGEIVSSDRLQRGRQDHHPHGGVRPAAARLRHGHA